MSLPKELLSDAGRAEILDFYGEVFGWEEMPTMTVPDRRLVLQAWRYDQFLFLTADDEPMRCPRMDHIGLAVPTMDDFEALHTRALARAEQDERVQVIGPEVDEWEFLTLRGLYIGFLLPMLIEVQHWQWAEQSSAS